MADPKHPRHYDEAFKRQIAQLCENGKHPGRSGRVRHRAIDPAALVQASATAAPPWPRTTARPSRTGSWSSSAENRRLRMEVDA